MAWHRDNVKRFFRLSSSSQPGPHSRTDSSLSAGSSSNASLPGHQSILPIEDCAEATRTSQYRASVRMLPGYSPSHTRTDSGSGMIGPFPENAMGSPASRNEKVVASGSGITVSIGLTEPVLFLEGYERNDRETRKTAMLRGRLRLSLSKPLKIKKVYLNFRGFAITTWPEGALPNPVRSRTSPPFWRATF